MDVNAKYDLSELQNFFSSWYSPEEFISILRRIALNMTLGYLGEKEGVELYSLKEDLDDIKNFTITLEQIKRVDK